jgi:hypothetical protein
MQVAGIRKCDLVSWQEKLRVIITKLTDSTLTQIKAIETK